jgi:hypothetical protein
LPLDIAPLAAGFEVVPPAVCAVAGRAKARRAAIAVPLNRYFIAESLRFGNCPAARLAQQPFHFQTT